MSRDDKPGNDRMIPESPSPGNAAPQLSFETIRASLHCPGCGTPFEGALEPGTTFVCPVCNVQNSTDAALKTQNVLSLPKLGLLSQVLIQHVTRRKSEAGFDPDRVPDRPGLTYELNQFLQATTSPERVFLLLGDAGTGKSAQMMQWALQLRTLGYTAFIFDPDLPLASQVQDVFGKTPEELLEAFHGLPVPPRIPVVWMLDGIVDEEAGGSPPSLLEFMLALARDPDQYGRHLFIVTTRPEAWEQLRDRLESARALDAFIWAPKELELESGTGSFPYSFTLSAHEPPPADEREKIDQYTHLIGETRLAFKARELDRAAALCDETLAIARELGEDTKPVLALLARVKEAQWDRDKPGLYSGLQWNEARKILTELIALYEMLGWDEKMPPLQQERDDVAEKLKIQEIKRQLEQQQNLYSELVARAEQALRDRQYADARHDLKRAIQIARDAQLSSKAAEHLLARVKARETVQAVDVQALENQAKKDGSWDDALREVKRLQAAYEELNRPDEAASLIPTITLFEGHREETLAEREKYTVEFQQFLAEGRQAVAARDFIQARTAVKRCLFLARTFELDPTPVAELEHAIEVASKLTSLDELIALKRYAAARLLTKNLARFCRKTHDTDALRQVLAKQAEIEKKIAERKTRTLLYHKTPLHAKDHEAMTVFEDETGIKVAPVEAVDQNTFGFATRDNHVVELGLYKRKLEALPESLGMLADLRALHARHNRLEHVPPELGQLSRLVVLNLNNNAITQIPKAFEGLAALHELHLFQNRLRELPSCLGALDALDTLIAGANAIRDVSPQLGGATALRVLDLDANNLIQLPSEIGRLIRLEELYLANNRLRVLPAALGNLRALRVLTLNENGLTRLPRTLLHLDHLEYLDLSFNPFPDRAENLWITQTLLPKLKKRGCRVFHTIRVL